MSDNLRAKFGLGFASKRKASDFFNDEETNEKADSLEDNSDFSANSKVNLNENNAIDEKTQVNLLDQMKNRVRDSLDKTTDSDVHAQKIMNSEPRAINAELLNAIDSENISSIGAIYQSQFPVNKPFFKQNRRQDSEQSNTTKLSGELVTSSSAKVELSQPLYKTLKSGDIVMAKYTEDGLFYSAEIKTVIHKGYPSAKYDIKFLDYDNSDTVSWKDVYVDPNLTKTSKAVPGVDDTTSRDLFGRDVEARLNQNEKTIASTSANQFDILRKRLKDTTKPSSVFENMKSDEFINLPYVEKLKGHWKIV